MYESFYGFSGKPFSLLPDGDSVFPSKRHKRAMTLLDYGVESQSGFIVISGEVGAGKTTIIRRFMKNVGADVSIGLITNPSASLGRLLDWIAMAFDLKERGANDSVMYESFVKFLLAQYAQGRRCMLVIDEAQNLPATMLEDLRMLSNVNNERDLLLQIVLVGQPELLDTMRRPELRQFVQRIAAHCHLGSLSPAETADYIRYRLKLVGGGEEIFDDVACAAVHRFTEGVPRLINLLCDQALVYGFSEDMKNIPFEIVAEVAIDRGSFGLSSFRNVPDVLVASQLRAELEAVLSAMRSDRTGQGS